MPLALLIEQRVPVASRVPPAPQAGLLRGTTLWLDFPFPAFPENMVGSVQHCKHSLHMAGMQAHWAASPAAVLLEGLPAAAGAHNQADGKHCSLYLPAGPLGGGAGSCVLCSD